MPSPITDNQQIKLARENAYEGLWTTYKIRLIKGAYDELLRYPPVKEYVTNSSSLENGVRYDLPQDSDYSTKFNEKNFSIELLIDASTKAEMETLLASFIGKYHTNLFHLKVVKLGSTTVNFVFKLVYRDCERLKIYRDGRGIFALKLTEINPADRI